jgi:ribosomal protein S18 acetylase RimI-like enzyme
MNNLSIRKASAKDIESIVKVRRAAFTDEEVRGFTTPGRSIFYSVIRLKRAWEEENRLKGGWEVYVALDKRSIIGFTVFKVEKGAGYIDNINVTKQKKGKGVGKALVIYVEEIVRSRGIRVMKTDTTENAEGKPWQSYGFWTKMGYKDTGERRPTKWDFKEISFVKNLE